MQRRGFISGATGLLAASTLPRFPGRADEHAAVKKLIERYYSVYYRERNKNGYLQLLTDDYLLLENGEVLTREQDVALMPVPGDTSTRTDAFDFISVAISGNGAYAIYYLTADISDDKGATQKRWLESVVAKRASQRAPWQVALLHSTRIEKQ